MRFLSLSLSIALFAGEAVSQVTFFVNPNPAVNGGAGIGTPQVVPEPFNPGVWPNGTLELFVDLCFGPNLYAYATGLPQGYLQGTQTQETMFFLADFGNAATPGVTISGGQFYTPGTPSAIVWTIGPALYIGPVGCGTGAGSFGMNNYGAFLNITGAIPPMPQGLSLCIQAVMLDSVLSQFFTSNAVNFQV